VYKRQEALRESNFVDTYASHIKSSFLLGFGSCKVLWDRGLTFSNVDVFNLHIDPDYKSDTYGHPKFHVEDKEMDLHKFKEMARRINAESGKKIYRGVNKIKEDARDTEKSYEDRSRRGISDHNPTDKRIRLLEYWGDIVDEKGRVIKKNQICVVANEKYLVRQQDNPFKHRLPPYILTTPIIYPHRGVWGVSLAAPVIKLQYAYNNIFNLYIDNLNFSVNKMFEYQPTNLLNPKALTMVYPGKTIAKHTANPALTEVPVSQVGQDAIMAMQMVQNEMEKGTAVTEYLMGLPGKTQTKAEVEIKTAQASGMFDTIARDIEQNSLRPLIGMCFELLMQFGDIPEELRGRIKFKVGGLTILLQKREQKQQIMEALQASLGSQELNKWTDTQELYRKYLEVLNLEDVYTAEMQGPNADQIAKMQDQARGNAQRDIGKMVPEQYAQAQQQLGAQ